MTVKIFIKEKKRNCGCNQDPCITYGIQKESKKEDNFKPHKMYDPKTGKMEMANKEEDHDRLGKKGYIHLDDDIFDKLVDVLEKEGGAAGLKPFEDELKKNTTKEIETALKNMDNVGKHEKGDYILGDEKEINIAEMIDEEIRFVLEKRKKRKKKKKKKSSGKKDACYHKVKSRYKVWPSAYASGALVRCRKVGAKNWGNKSKKK